VLWHKAYCRQQYLSERRGSSWQNYTHEGNLSVIGAIVGPGRMLEWDGMWLNFHCLEIRSALHTFMESLIHYRNFHHMQPTADATAT
jgi:hypothetical protein